MKRRNLFHMLASLFVAPKVSALTGPLVEAPPMMAVDPAFGGGESVVMVFLRVESEDLSGIKWQSHVHLIKSKFRINFPPDGGEARVVTEQLSDAHYPLPPFPEP